jgi:hypothetical protein
VPAGSYQVSAAMTGYGSGSSGYFFCELISPAGSPMDFRFGNVDSSILNTSMSLQRLLSTTGGTLTVQCRLNAGTTHVYNSSLIATQVGSASGAVTPNAVKAGTNLPPTQPTR